MDAGRAKLASKVLGGIAVVLLALALVPRGAGAPDQAQAEELVYPVYGYRGEQYTSGSEPGLQDTLDYMSQNPKGLIPSGSTTLQLQQDIRLDADRYLTIPANIVVTIDLNGHSITAGADSQPFVHVEGTVSFVNSQFSGGTLSSGSHRSYVYIAKTGSLQLGSLCTISASGPGYGQSYAVESYGRFLCNGKVESANSAAKAVGILSGGTFESNGTITGDVDVQGGTMYAGSASSISGVLNISAGSTLSKTTPGSFFEELVYQRQGRGGYGSSATGAHKVTFSVGGNTVVEYYANSRVFPPYGSGRVESPAVAWNLNGQHYDFSQELTGDIVLEGVQNYDFNMQGIEQEYTGSPISASAIKGRPR